MTLPMPMVVVLVAEICYCWTTPSAAAVACVEMSSWTRTPPLTCGPVGPLIATAAAAVAASPAIHCCYGT